jgi:hypothetical protein
VHPVRVLAVVVKVDAIHRVDDRQSGEYQEEKRHENVGHHHVAPIQRRDGEATLHINNVQFSLKLPAYNLHCVVFQIFKSY